MTEFNYEQILSQVKNLPPEFRGILVQEILKLDSDSPDFASTNGREARHPKEPVIYKEPKHNIDPTASMNWLREHRVEYGGQWVALDGSRLIAHGPNAVEVHAAAKADGAYLPLITYIEPADALPFIF